LRHRIQASARFQDNGDGVGVTRHVNEMNKFVDICFYISLALKVGVQLKAHEHGCCLILWAKDGHEFQGEVCPICEGHDSGPYFLSYYTFSKRHHASGLEE
jgi:hypothetical protein